MSSSEHPCSGFTKARLYICFKVSERLDWIRFQELAGEEGQTFFLRKSWLYLAEHIQTLRLFKRRVWNRGGIAKGVLLAFWIEKEVATRSWYQEFIFISLVLLWLIWNQVKWFHQFNSRGQLASFCRQPWLQCFMCFFDYWRRLLFLLQLFLKFLICSFSLR